jgi:putative PIN family toxin of toxin-antitoxin system
VIRAVIDTNVLVSGLLSALGNEALIIVAVNQGLVRPCLSEAIIAEYAEVLTRPKFSFPPDEVEALIAMLRRNGELHRTEVSSVTSPDPGDSKFLQCAQAAGGEFIITGNKRHFPDAPYGPTRVVNASEVLDRITREL